MVIEVFNSGGSQRLDIPEPPSSCPVPSPLTPEMTKVERYQAYRQRMALRRRKAEMYSLWCDALYRLSLANHVSVILYIEFHTILHMFIWFKRTIEWCNVVMIFNCRVGIVSDPRFLCYSSGNASSGFHIIWIFEDECTHVRLIWTIWVLTWQDHFFVLLKENHWDQKA